MGAWLEARLRGASGDLHQRRLIDAWPVALGCIEHSGAEPAAQLFQRYLKLVSAPGFKEDCR
jgi:hypothetical protein